MTAIRDPYPEELLAEIPDTASDPLVNAIVRLAQAVEANTAALLHQQPTQNPSQAPSPYYVAPPSITSPLAALPPVQTVAAKPACPRHGIDKVAPSTQFQGFYCQAKARPGEPQNNKGYCNWSVRL